MDYILILLGIKIDLNNLEEKNNHIEKMIIIGDFMKKKFGDLTTEEVKEAFRMYVAREFPKIKPFRIIDPLNVGEVLNAFVIYSNDHLKIYRDKKSLLAEKNKEKELAEKNEKAFNNLLTDLTLHFINTGEIKQTYLFNELHKRGEFKFLTKEKINKIKRKAYKILCKEKGSGDDSLNQIKRIAKIKFLQKRGVDETEILKNINNSDLKNNSHINYEISKIIKRINKDNSPLKRIGKELVLKEYLTLKIKCSTS